MRRYADHPKSFRPLGEGSVTVSLFGPCMKEPAESKQTSVRDDGNGLLGYRRTPVLALLNLHFASTKLWNDKQKPHRILLVAHNIENENQDLLRSVALTSPP